MHKKSTTNFSNNFSASLNDPAILTAADVSRLKSLQDEFCAECGKNMILVAYKN